MDINKPEYSKKDLWFVITKTAIVTFVLAGIFFRFIAVENKQLDILQGQEDLKVLIEAKNEYTNKRVDTKTDRNKELIIQNHLEIDELKQKQE